MRNNVILVSAILALGFGGWGVLKSFQSTANEISLGTEPDEITYICTETGSISHGELKSTPAVNPATGRRTLVQALYCAQCKKWYPSPPPEMAERSPRGPVCAISGGPLTVSEPEALDEPLE